MIPSPFFQPWKDGVNYGFVPDGEAEHDGREADDARYR
jgi:hypothetical protein